MWSPAAIRPLLGTLLLLAAAATAGPMALASQTFGALPSPPASAATAAGPSTAAPSPSASSAPAAEPPPYELTRPAPGILAAVQPPALYFRDSNVTLVRGEGAALVVDAGSDPAKVEWLVERVQQELADGGEPVPVRYLVATHWHGDHTQGLATWRRAWPQLVVVGHRSLLEDVPRRAVPMLAEETAKLADAIAAAENRRVRGVDEEGGLLDETAKAELAASLERARRRLARLESVVIPPPDVALPDLGERPPAPADAVPPSPAGVEPAVGDAPGGSLPGALRIDLGGRVVEILALPGHTRGDLVAWLPAERVLLSGDILDALPYGGHGDPGPWIASLERLAELPFEVLVPGHGPVYRGAEARRQLDRVDGLFRWLVTEARAAVRRGDDDETALAALRASAGWEEHRRRLAGDGGLFDRVWESFVPETYHRALAEARAAAGAP